MVDGEGQGDLVCCSPWGCKEPDVTGQLNRNNLYAAILTDVQQSLEEKAMTLSFTKVKSMTKTFSSSDKGHKVAEINLSRMD